MSEKLKIVIIGAGGHGKVIADAILKESKNELIGFIDDKINVGEIIYGNYKVIANSSDNHIMTLANAFIVAIGNNEVREIIFNKFNVKLIPATVVHPSSVLALDTNIGKGSVILAGVIINPGVEIGINTIINSKSLIDHDVQIGNHVHIGQAAIIGSGNKIKDGDHVKQGTNKFSIFH